MKYAKARFNSTAVPLQRSVLFFEAVWRFCVDVVVTRAGRDPAKFAATFLANITTEAVIQAAMMADAADEHMLIRRFFDSESWDVASIGSELDGFLRRVEFLFIPAAGAAAGCLNQGFVRYACQLLAKPRVCWVGGSQRTIGGPGAVTEQLLGKCLSRMANWLRLTISAVSAEFPDWQLTQSMSVFNLEPPQAPADAQAYFERLAAAFELDAAILMREYEEARPMAARFYRQAGTRCSMGAWVQAAFILQKPRRLGRTAYLNSPLLRILHVAQCWIGLSTSRIEQHFSKIKTVATGVVRAGCAEQTESLEARLCCDLLGAPEEFKAKVFSEADEIWSGLWPRQRQCGPERKTLNFSRKRKACDQACEAAFLRKRRRKTAQAAHSNRTRTEMYESAASAGSATWDATLATKEAKLQANAEASKYSGQHKITNKQKQKYS